jgi:5'-phosphate synthase pdxT subunit
MLDFNLANEIKDLVRKGMPVFGTCAGMILMSENVTGSYPETLGLMALTAKRNAFGRQKDSFETELSVPVLGDMPFPAVFIRAPVIRAVNGKAKILAKLADGTPVAARQDTMLVSAFHPELTDDLRFHRYFIDIVAGKK